MAQSNSSITQTTKTWELTPYELQRTPQEVMTDGTEISVTPRSLHSELMCPICLDMLRNTMTTKECLHRFCSECITTALRSGNKECPTCRKKLVSRRSLRPDPNFDALIAKIYPSRDEYEAQQEKVLQSITKHHNQAALANSIEEGLKSQAMSRNSKVKKQEQASSQTSTESKPKQEVLNAKSVADDKENASQQSTSTNPTATSASNSNETKSPKQKETTDSPLSKKRKVVDDKPTGPSDSMPKTEVSSPPTKKEVQGHKDTIDLELHAHPDQSKPSVFQTLKFVKTSAKATVQHISQFIAMRVALEKKSSKAVSTSDIEASPDYLLYVKNQDKTFTELSFGSTLEKVQKDFHRDARLQIYFLKMS